MAPIPSPILALYASSSQLPNNCLSLITIATLLLIHFEQEKKNAAAFEKAQSEIASKTTTAPAGAAASGPKAANGFAGLMDSDSD